jgi:hypothetical protein
MLLTNSVLFMKKQMGKIGNKLKVDRSIYEILQILSISFLGKTPIKEILTKCDFNNVKELQNKQLIISGF